MTDEIENSPLLNKFHSYLELTNPEKKLLMQLNLVYETLPPETLLFQPEEASTDVFLMLKGWAYSFRDSTQGERQISNYFINCDFMGLSMLMEPERDYYLSTLTESRVCRIPINGMLTFFQDAPRLALTICSLICSQNELLTEQIMRISKRSAYQRTGHFLLELFNRLETASGNNILKTIQFPITQEMLADTLGMTPVHVNRTMKKLKKDGLIEYDSNSVTLMDRPNLEKVTEFNKSYLSSRNKKKILSDFE